MAAGNRGYRQGHPCDGRYALELGRFLPLGGTLSSWQGQAGDTAVSSILLIAGKHDVTADQLKGAAGAMDHAEADAQGVANKVRDLLNYAAESPSSRSTQTLTRWSRLTPTT